MKRNLKLIEKEKSNLIDSIMIDIQDNFHSYTKFVFDCLKRFLKNENIEDLIQYFESYEDFNTNTEKDKIIELIVEDTKANEYDSREFLLSSISSVISSKSLKELKSNFNF